MPAPQVRPPSAPGKALTPEDHNRFVSLESTRLGALTRLLADLASSIDQADLIERTILGLPRVLDPLHRTELLVVNPRTRELEMLAEFGEGDLVREMSEHMPLVVHGHRRAGRSDAVRAPKLVTAGRTATHGARALVPLRDAQTLVGLLLVEREQPLPNFEPGDLQALVALATQLTNSLKLQQAELRSATHLRYESDLKMARQIQLRFLPALPEEMEGLRLAAEYRPAFEVGGDFYDLVPTVDGGVVAVIGDVSGKGVAAALIMARVMSEFRRLAREATSPGDLLGELNRLIVELGHDDSFVTATCLLFDRDRRHMKVANAGHVPPVVRRPTGQAFVVEPHTGAPLGMLETEAYLDREIELDRGDIVLLMTDGITEALELDMRILLDLVSVGAHQMTEITRRIVEVAEQKERHVDDIALLAIQVPEAVFDFSDAGHQAA